MFKRIANHIKKFVKLPSMGETSIDSFRTQKLHQICLMSFACLIFLILNAIYIGNYERAILLAVVFILITCCFFWAKYKNFEHASRFFLGMLTLACCFFMWRNEGMADESLLIFPGLLIFAAMITNFTVAVILLLVMVVNVLALGYVNENGIYINEPYVSNMDNAFLIVAILIFLTFSVSFVASELHQLILKLNKENKQVKRSQIEIERLLNHDALTGLPNRILAKEFFKKQLALSKRQGKSVALLLLDMDDFKSLNDTLGHSVGDEYLKTLSEKLTKQLRKSDTVCRIAGDEFVIIAEHSEDESGENHLAKKILDSLREPIHLASQLVPKELDAYVKKPNQEAYQNELILSASIGIALSSTDGSDFETLFNKADTAMYKAKESGRNNYCYFNPEMSSGKSKQLTIAQALRYALTNNELSIHYQSKQLLQSGKITGAEVLLRWHHPVLGQVSPDEFIPIAERTGIICEIGEWVLEEAIKSCKGWHNNGFADLSVSVNVSSIQLKRGNFDKTLLRLLDKYQFEGRFLILELTESILIDMQKELSVCFGVMQSSGVRLAIDDFGTGYSNLGYLKKFDISMLKIDRSFIFKINSSEQDFAIVKAIIDMSNSLEIQTVAEGIETKEIADLLLNLRCELGQGYLWNKPMPADNFIEYIKNNAK